MFKKLYMILFSTSLLMSTPVKHNTHKTNHKKSTIKKSKKHTKKSTTKHKKVTKKNSKKSAKKVSKSHKTKQVNKKYTLKDLIKQVSKDHKPREYTVRNGDTIFSIARKFKVSILDIYKINKLKPTSSIYPGNKLKIPSVGYEQKAKEAVAKNKKTVYKVKKGDTLGSVAKKFNMKIADVLKINSFRKKSTLSIGQEINVYAKKETLKKRQKVTKYVVKSGDTIWSIAKRYNLTIKQLRLLNPKIRSHSLRKGSILSVSKDKAIKLAQLANKRKKRLSGTLAKFSKTHPTSTSNNRVVRYAKRFLGTRYIWGATGRGGFDCSGFTQFVYRHAKGRIIPRISRRQAYYGKYVSRRNLRPADLVFFDTSHRRRGYVNHVGMFIGNHLFIHASSAKHRVVITSLRKPFYAQRFMWGRRIY